MGRPRRAGCRFFFVGGEEGGGGRRGADAAEAEGKLALAQHLVALSLRWLDDPGNPRGVCEFDS